MRRGIAFLILAAALMLSLIPTVAHATDRCFTNGYGTCSQGMGGAGVAFPIGQLSAATNPASLAAGDAGWEIGVGPFNPNRSYTVTGTPSGYPGTFGLAPGEVSSDSSLFFMPQFGFSKKMGEWSPMFSFGASYQSRTYMSKFDKYSGLFAEQGEFDIPSSWTIGIGLKPTKALDLAFDVQRIRYSDVKSVGHPMLPNLTQSALGTAGGAGFGWQDMTVFEAGLPYRAGGRWTWRGCNSYGNQPVPSSEVLFNILAPGVVQQHATIGFSKEVAPRRSFDFALTRAFSSTVTGPNPLEVPGKQQIAITMEQWVFTFGYSVRFK